MSPAGNKRTVLIGEDELEVRAYLEMALKCLGYEVESAENGDEVLECLQSMPSKIAAVLLDLTMPQRGGLDTLSEIRRDRPDLPVIVVTGSYSPTTVVSAMKAGATDFLCKPVTHEDLRKALDKAMDGNAGKAGKIEAMPSRSSAAKTGAFFGMDPKIRELYSLVAQIGWSEAPVLIQGETGSGKEVLARELHAQSPRASRPFLKLNCAALPFELVESELFGYERGAFTGAFQKKAGMFEMADGGTILLDEIGDMDVRLQAKLLQVLQDQEFQRIGGKETIRVDVRVMAATHRDLELAIADKTFREDLYYRLNVISLQLPPLRERKGDIVPLAEFLLKRHAGTGRPTPQLTWDLKNAMMSYHWPGNVRELENIVRKLIVLRHPEMVIRELQNKSSRRLAPSLVLGPQPPIETFSSPVAVEGPAILEQVTKAKQLAETDAIVAALNSTRWNRKRAAAVLQIDYKALLYKMKKLGLEDKMVPLAPKAASPTASGIFAANGD